MDGSEAARTPTTRLSALVLLNTAESRDKHAELVETAIVVGALPTVYDTFEMPLPLRELKWGGTRIRMELDIPDEIHEADSYRGLLQAFDKHLGSAIGEFDDVFG